MAGLNFRGIAEQLKEILIYGCYNRVLMKNNERTERAYWNNEENMDEHVMQSFKH